MSNGKVPALPRPDEAIRILKENGCHKKVIEHCTAVADFAAVITKRLQARGVKVDADLVQVGAMLHDLGRSKSHGIDHAVEGARLAKELGLDPKVINIIERHIGAGISADEAVRLGLPRKDYIPETIEEKVVCHADNMCNFKRHNVEVTIEKLEKKGQKGAADLMRRLHKELSDMAGIDLNDL
jgi:uncharacterized protein